MAGALTPLVLWETPALIETIDRMDKTCGLSRALQTAVRKRTEPAYRGFGSGLMAWIGAQGL